MLPLTVKAQHLSRLYVSVTHPIFQQHVRTTFILRRRFAPFSKKVEDPTHKKLRVKHFIYNLVEDRNTIRAPDVKVILTSYVEGLGDRGTVVSARPTQARFDLLLPGLAVYASPENLQMLKDDILLSKEREPTFSSAFAPITIKFMRKMIFEVMMNSEEPWTISAWHIKVALRTAGIVVPVEAIELPNEEIIGPNMDYQNKDFAVFITINERERFPIRCRLHHTGVPLDDDWQLTKSDAILQEQVEILDSIPYPSDEKKK